MNHEISFEGLGGNSMKFCTSEKFLILYGSQWLGICSDLLVDRLPRGKAKEPIISVCCVNLGILGWKTQCVGRGGNFLDYVPHSVQVSVRM